MGSEAEEYAAFKEKVKRMVYLDNLSPKVTEEVLVKAFEQFHGTLTSIRFIPNYTKPSITAKCALLEYKTEEEAKEIINMLSKYQFMILGMPRPVRACPARPEMFEDRPIMPGRRIQLYWLDPKDPGFKAAEKMKNLAKKHAAEWSFLLKKQIEEEEKLSKQQAEILKDYHQKTEMINSVLSDGTTKDLARRYGVRLTDDTGI